MEKSKILVVIPARLMAKRLPRKLLINLLGKPLIQWVYEGCKTSQLADKIIIATDSKEIFDVVKGFGGEVMMTSSEHKTGSDRVAEVAEKMPEFDIVINAQGDNPFVTGELLDSLIKPLVENPEIEMAALKSRINNKEDIENPSISKVITNKNGFAIAYSRSVIPHPYSKEYAGKYYRNKGLYGFKRDFLLKYVNLEQGPLEKAESLEQMRAIEHGYKIYVIETDVETAEINVPEDVANVEGMLKERENKKRKFENGE